ncbi:hypothetical protein EBZ80_27370, partial [bacterium]|nr:hypothetical protein [bacterium]
MVLAGNISGGGGLTKSSNNTVTLSGQNSYSGATAVVNGKLQVITNNIFATITTNTVAITFSNTPAVGGYRILPGALSGVYTASFSGLDSSTQKASFTASDSTVTVAALNPPAGLSYSPSAIIGTVGQSISPLAPTVGGGTVTAYSVSPDLPSGLSINPSTGTISGTPSSVSSSASYTVTASNADGSTTASVSVTVNPASLPTVSFTAPSNLTYDRTAKTYQANATGPSSLTLTYTGRNGLTYNSTNAPTNVGDYTVTATTSDGNYTGSQATNFSIAAKALTISGATATGRSYDGTTNVVVSGGSLVGVVSGDTVDLSSTSAAGTVSSPAVGSGKSVTVTGYFISGASAGNYSLTQPTLSADITARSLTVTAEAKNKTAGASDPALTYQVTAGSLVSGDSFSGALTRDS